MHARQACKIWTDKYYMMHLINRCMNRMQCLRSWRDVRLQVRERERVGEWADFRCRAYPIHHLSFLYCWRILDATFTFLTIILPSASICSPLHKQSAYSVRAPPGGHVHNLTVCHWVVLTQFWVMDKPKRWVKNVI